MAFAGLHIVCAVAGSDSKKETERSQSLLAIAENGWSETLAAAGTSTKSVPTDQPYILHVIASADSYVAIGAVPNAGQAVSSTRQNTRFLAKAGVEYDIYAKSGDKVAYVLA